MRDVEREGSDPWKLIRANRRDMQSILKCYSDDEYDFLVFLFGFFCLKEVFNEVLLFSGSS